MLNMKLNGRKRSNDETTSSAESESFSRRSSISSRNAIFSSYSSSKRQKMFVESSRKRSLDQNGSDSVPTKKISLHPLTQNIENRCDLSPRKRSSANGEKNSSSSTRVEAADHTPNLLFKFKNGKTAKLKRRPLFCSKERVPKLVKSQEMKYEDITADRCRESIIDDVLFQEQKKKDPTPASEKPSLGLLPQTDSSSLFPKSANVSVTPRKLTRARSSEDLRTGKTPESATIKPPTAAAPHAAVQTTASAAVVSLIPQTTKSVKASNYSFSTSTTSVTKEHQVVGASLPTLNRSVHFGSSVVPIVTTAASTSLSSGPAAFSSTPVAPSTTVSLNFPTPAVSKSAPALTFGAVSTPKSALATYTTSAPALAGGLASSFKFGTTSVPVGTSTLTFGTSAAKTNHTPALLGGAAPASTVSTANTPITGVSTTPHAPMFQFGSASAPKIASSLTTTTNSLVAGTLANAARSSSTPFKFGASATTVNSSLPVPSFATPAAATSTAATTLNFASPAISSSAPPSTFKFGSQTNKPTATSSMFNFGGSSANTKAARPNSLTVAPASGSLFANGSKSTEFIFSSKPVSTSASAPTFDFGSAPAANAPPAFGAPTGGTASKGFSFGGSAVKAVSAAPPAFNFGATAQAPAPLTFSFGGAAPTNTTGSSQPTKFVFGANNAPPSGQTVASAPSGQNPMLKNILLSNSSTASASASPFSFGKASSNSTPAFGSNFQTPPNPFGQNAAPTAGFNLGTSNNVTPQQRPRARAMRTARRQQRK